MIAATAPAAAANRASVESDDWRRKLSIAAATMKSGTDAATSSSAGLAASRSAAATVRRRAASTALPISKPAVEKEVIPRSSVIAWGSSQAQKIGHAASREKIQANAPSVIPLYKTRKMVGTPARM